MIKFFRHIRYNLIETGKTIKYLKYAIGEIVLVVIGILIALQINNWNETKKLRALEIEKLVEIKQALAGYFSSYQKHSNINYQKRAGENAY